MDFYEVVRTRESVRNYDPERPVEPEVLKRIFEAGRLAPSAANRQPWTFNLISSPAMLEKVRRCYNKSWFRDAPHILVVTGRKAAAWTRSYDGYNSVETDLTIVLDHLILAATAEGVGTCWIEAYEPAVLREALELSDDEEIFSITPLGYPRAGYARRQKSRKSLDEIVKQL